MRAMRSAAAIIGTVLLLTVAPFNPATAAIKMQTIDYQQGGVTLEGFLAYDDATTAKRPGILVFPQFKGVSDHEKGAAKRLAELGFAAFVGDIYGKGVFHQDRKAAATESEKYFNDRPLVRARAHAALAELLKSPLVDASRIAAIGYCFGGMAALELARSGADVEGVVTFHGDLATKTPEDAKNIKGHVLALHGAADPVVTPDQVAAFEKEMSDAKVDWQLIAYSDAVHAFTEPDDPTAPRTRVAYNEKADKRSWIAMKDFLQEIFAK